MVKNMRKGMHHRSETYAKEFAAAEQRVEKADAMPRGTEKEALIHEHSPLVVSVSATSIKHCD